MERFPIRRARDVLQTATHPFLPCSRKSGLLGLICSIMWSNVFEVIHSHADHCIKSQVQQQMGKDQKQ